MGVWGYLYWPDGGVRVMRLVVTLVSLVILAFFGTVLLFATTAVSDSTAVQVIWVLLAIAGLKLPLIALLWHFVLANREWPGRRPDWGPRESREILAYIEMEAARAEHRADAEARLAYLSGEAWNVADAMSGDRKVDALTVALRVDEMRSRAARRAR
jgi:hypothetical protein